MSITFSYRPIMCMTPIWLNTARLSSSAKCLFSHPELLNSVMVPAHSSNPYDHWHTSLRANSTTMESLPLGTGGKPVMEKNKADGAGGVVKNAATSAVIKQDELIRNPQEFFNFCIENLSAILPKQ